MDSKQDNNKLRPLKNEQLPIELQWENMEAGILNKMEALQSAVPTDKKEQPRRRILLICLLLLGVLLPTLFFLNHKPASENPVDFTSSPAVPAERTDLEEVNEVGKAAPLPTTATEQPAAAKANAPQAYVPLDNKQESRIAVEQNEAYSPTEIASALVETPSNDPKKPTSYVTAEHISVNKQESNVTSTMLNTDHQLKVSSTDPASLTPVDQLAERKEMTPVVSQSSKEEVVLPALALSTTAACPIFKTHSAQVWLMGGASWWSAGYGNTKPERADFEQTILSSQGQFSYVQPMKKDLFLLVGLQYQQLENRLNWDTQLEDYQLTLEDTIIQIRRNAITGATTEVRGDITLTVTAERKVQHFNSFSLVQVPLGIGKTWGKGSLQPHLLVGGVANLSFSKQGRTLYQAELIDYDDSSSIWTDQLSFSAMLSGGLNYRITDRLGMMMVIQYQHSLSNWSTEQGITMRPSILNGSFGVNYSL